MFAGYPAPFVHSDPNGKKVQQLLWGDFVEVGPQRLNGWREVIKARNTSGWMREKDLQDERLLEINFVDVGQGDGCLIVTPADRFIVVDAGKADNLFWFLRWRFNLRADPTRVLHLDHVVISHSDEDHYGGFDSIFESAQFTIGTLHHNGLIERTGDDLLGPRSPDGKYQTDLVRTTTALRRLLTSDAIGTKHYPKLLKTALSSGRVNEVRMLSALDAHLPGYDNGDLVISVDGPVPEKLGRQLALRRFGDDGKTKNGHSVILKLRYKNVSMLLGGDLNEPAERYLLESYTGLNPSPTTAADRQALVDAARATFECDIAKSCHHGSGDFADEFMQALNPLATVVSSGDSEPFAHPRPDALGAFGRYGRGPRPLIFSTELARSPTETVRRPETQRRLLADSLALAREEIARDGTSPEEAPGRVVHSYQRAVAVYGMINLRTDGEKVVMAQKLERASASKEWDFHCLRPVRGELQYVSDDNP